MAKLPKSYIKKYGISKKAWSEYKKTLKKGSGKKRSGNPSKKKGGKKKNVAKSSGSILNFGGGLGKGIMVGVAAGVVNKFIPIDIAGADLIIAGMILKDSTCQKIGAITLGRNLAGSITGLVGGALGGNNSGGGNGGFL